MIMCDDDGFILLPRAEPFSSVYFQLLTLNAEWARHNNHQVI